ncbi:conserved hypothetical protein [Nautilia profundicola AmH]|uniref:Uncharacterized protein n=1 Tax=Nautilia profundicola (strain ATCC BAA-1463 / DSM 18972 / AmH) TaxID=598659 RepID=B9L9G4_NAUPA|nr:hypothetical protein [Nautilia profundicola]ACM92138.1 conserved hypothetical protein [Nautilia profundicola AmH]
MNSEVQAYEKAELLENIEDYIEQESLSRTIIRNLILTIVFSLTILFPKIYISSEIYIKSVQINKLLNEYYSLKAENSLLASKIEKIKFKNRMEKLTF